MVRMNLSTYFSNCLNFSVLSLSSYFSNPYVLIRHPPSCFSKSIKRQNKESSPAGKNSACTVQVTPVSSPTSANPFISFIQQFLFLQILENLYKYPVFHCNLPLNTFLLFPNHPENRPPKILLLSRILFFYSRSLPLLLLSSVYHPIGKMGGIQKILD